MPPRSKLEPMSTYLALVCEQLSDDLSGLRLRAMTRRALAPSEVRVRIHGAGLNFPDLLMTRGGYQFKPDLPFVPGMEGSGTVLECGSQASAWRPGDEVCFNEKTGALAQEIVLPAAALRRRPEQLDLDEAACHHVTGLTAVVALEVIGKLRPSERLLVHGARGGVGHACARLGQHLGADVLATATDPEQIAALAALGIRTLSAKPGFRDAVLQHTEGHGADVVVDPVGGDVFDESMRAVAWGGRLLVLGFASGRIATLATNRALIKGLAVFGVRAGEYLRRYPAQRAAVFARVEALANQGVLRPLIGRSYTLGEAVQALRALEGRGVPGKILVRAADTSPATAGPGS